MSAPVSASSRTVSPSIAIALAGSIYPILRARGTDVLAPKDPRREFNLLNKQLPFEDVEVINTFPFTPNQCVVFVKTFNSLHAVRPMLGKGSEAMRRTLTINIEQQHT